MMSLSNTQSPPKLPYLEENEDGIDFESLADDLAEFSGDPLVVQALKRGVDLKKYSDELDTDLKAAEMECVTQYVNNSEQVSELHSQIQECDAVLARMQDMLLSFQGDLSGISGEIKHLQNESLSMSVRLRNKRAIENKLSAFVTQAVISPEVINCILSPTVNDKFLMAVQELNVKLDYIDTETVPSDGSTFTMLPKETTAGSRLRPDMLSLKAKSMAKAREFFVTQISSLRKNKTNVQVIQQNSLLKYKQLYHFLQKDAPSIADEIKGQYEETMSRIVLNVFKNYYAQLLKLDLIIAGKNDLLVIEESSIKSVFTQKITFSAEKSTVSTDTFALGDRANILDSTVLESEPILLHVALAEGQRFTYESIMRSVLKHLVDAASSEYLFLLDFFQSDNTNKNTNDDAVLSKSADSSAINTIFDAIYSKALSTLLENMENYLLNCYDAIGLLILLKVQHSLKLIMQRRRISVLDIFFNRLEAMLWPRLHAILTLNTESLRNATQRKLGAIELAPLYVSRRYADLCSSLSYLLSLSNSSGGHSGSNIEMNNLLINMKKIRLELIELLQRLGLSHFMTRKDQNVFFINNYDKILSIYEDRGCNIETDDSSAFENLLMQQREFFAEEEVRGAFPRLVSFVTQTEQMLHNAQVVVSASASNNLNDPGSEEPSQLDEGIVESLVREFSSVWRNGIQQINDDVLAYFANFRNGMEILKQVLTQLLLYYTRFQEIIKKAWPGTAPAFTRDIVSTATIMMEIKKYNRNL